MKFKAARTHFLSDVFVAIAFVVAQADPIFFQFCAISIHTVRDSFYVGTKSYGIV